MISITNIDYRTESGYEVLKSLSLELAPGNIYGLVGKNGEGKSTLLKILGGLLRISTGTCTIFGKPSIARLPSVLEDIFLVPEILINYSDRNIHSFALLNMKFFSHFDLELFFTLLNQFKIEKTKKFQHLSKGQIRIVFTCFGIATNSKILMLDEAMDGIDIESKDILKQALISRFQDDNIIIISTHQVEDLNGIIDRILILSEKSIVVNQSMDNINRKFTSKLLKYKEDSDAPLYIDNTLKGKIFITEKQNEFQSEITPELFYKTYLNSKNQVIKILNKLNP